MGLVQLSSEGASQDGFLKVYFSREAAVGVRQRAGTNTPHGAVYAGEMRQFVKGARCEDVYRLRLMRIDLGHLQLASEMAMPLTRPSQRC